MRLAGELEPQGRLARLLVGIDDPFCLKPENRDLPRVLVDSLVSAEIQGRALESVFAIERPHVRENDNTVWIMNDADQLEIRPIEILFGDATHVYVSDGLTEGERLVVTDIAAPVAGMALRLANAPGQAPNTAMEGGY